MATTEFFAMLKQEHKDVKGILGQLAATTKRAPKGRDGLFHELRAGLVPHMKAEEASFYPSLLQKKKARESGLEAMEEHHVAETVLQDLENMSKDDDRWGAKLRVFKELVEHHIQEEETTVFGSAKAVLNDGELQTIMEQFELQKQRTMRGLE